MTKIASQYETRTPVDIGCAVITEIPTSSINLPGTVNALATVTSNLILTGNFKNWILGLLMTQNGQIDIDYFADANGVWQIGTASMMASANTQAVLVVPNKIGVQSLRIRVTNNNPSSSATISNYYLALQAS